MGWRGGRRSRHVSKRGCKYGRPYWKYGWRRWGGIGRSMNGGMAGGMVGVTGVGMVGGMEGDMDEGMGRGRDLDMSVCMGRGM